MNDALNHYADDDRVISIHGYMSPVAEQLPTTFFLRGADCWGWQLGRGVGLYLNRMQPSCLPIYGEKIGP